GCLLVFAGASQIAGWAERWRFHGAGAWIAGALSGLFGGLVGNQGGIRSAALLGFNLAKRQFVATATAIALFVDAARMPVYAWNGSRALAEMSATIVIATAGVLAGTLGGGLVLHRVPERVFRRVVAVVILALGIAVLVRGRA